MVNEVPDRIKNEWPPVLDGGVHEDPLRIDATRRIVEMTEAGELKWKMVGAKATCKLGGLTILCWWDRDKNNFPCHHIDFGGGEVVTLYPQYGEAFRKKIDKMYEKYWAKTNLETKVRQSVNNNPAW